MTQSKKAFVIILTIIILVGIIISIDRMMGKKNILNSKSASQKKITYVASGHPEWSPIMWRQKDNIIGAGPELVELIAKDLGVKVKTKYVGLWDEAQAKAKSGEVDMLVAAYKTKEREEYMDYSIPYTVDPVALFVAKGKIFQFSQWQDLIGKKGVATVGDSYGQEFDDYIASKLDVKRVNSADEAFNMVKNGTADYFVYNLYSGEKAIRTGGMTESIEIIPQYVTQEDFYVTVSKKSNLASSMDKINESIEKYKNDGTIERLIQENRAKED
jgi:polar amino acid transport system substrate-binding protein